MTSSVVRLRRKLDQVPGGTALTPAAFVSIAVGTVALAAWLWSRTTQPDIDAATLDRLQPRQPVQQGA